MFKSRKFWLAVIGTALQVVRVLPIPGGPEIANAAMILFSLVIGGHTATDIVATWKAK